MAAVDHARGRVLHRAMSTLCGTPGDATHELSAFNGFYRTNLFRGEIIPRCAGGYSDFRKVRLTPMYELVGAVAALLGAAASGR
jgi:hypothetical protein